jgi:hypothetical protein
VIVMYDGSIVEQDTAQLRKDEGIDFWEYIIQSDENGFAQILEAVDMLFFIFLSIHTPKVSLDELLFLTKLSFFFHLTRSSGVEKSNSIFIIN